MRARLTHDITMISFTADGPEGGVKQTYHKGLEGDVLSSGKMSEDDQSAREYYTIKFELYQEYKILTYIDGRVVELIDRGFNDKSKKINKRTRVF
jgi:hypothetical protein